MSQEATFKKHGGYFIDGVAYMDCRETGEPVPNVSLTSVSVMSSTATLNRCLGLMSDSERDKLFGVKTGSGRVVRPRGWKWMAEFVDGDGTVWLKGVEQPDLKGKRPITDIEALRAKRKSAKETKYENDQAKLLKMAAEKQELQKAIAAQKDFLNHNVGGTNAEKE